MDHGGASLDGHSMLQQHVEPASETQGSPEIPAPTISILQEDINIEETEEDPEEHESQGSDNDEEEGGVTDEDQDDHVTDTQQTHMQESDDGAEEDEITGAELIANVMNGGTATANMELIGAGNQELLDGWGFQPQQVAQMTASDIALPGDVITASGFISSNPTGDPTSDTNTIVPAALYQIYPPMDHTCRTFFEFWGQMWHQRRAPFAAIDASAAFHHSNKRPARILPDSEDMQGIDWRRLGTDKKTAHSHRRMTTKNHTNMMIEGQAIRHYGTTAYAANFKSKISPEISNRSNFFRLKQTVTKRLPCYSHLQLRHNLSASSKNALFYVSSLNEDKDVPHLGYSPPQMVRCSNRASDTAQVVLSSNRKHDFSCLSAEHDVLVAGVLHSGDYMMKSLHVDAKADPVSGQLNTSMTEGVNHVQNFLERRSGLPQAAFCTNDYVIRVVECKINKVIKTFQYPSPVNCSAISPDGRLRVLVSDDAWPLVTDADTGEVLARLPGHKDHGFACAFSPDGINMATGHQDGIVQIWDTRFTGRCLHSLPAEMTGARSLTFSPLGSGYPVLVMAENVDFVSVVDARTFKSKQDIEFFGEIAGVTMPPDDRTLFVGNADPDYGGIMEFERTGEGRSLFDGADLGPVVKLDPHLHGDRRRFVMMHHRCFDGPSWSQYRQEESETWERDREKWKASPCDWLVDDEVDCDPRVRVSRTQRQRSRIELGKLHM